MFALANDALPQSDPRKFTRDDLDLLHALVDATNNTERDALGLLATVERLCEKIAALLPPR